MQRLTHVYLLALLLGGCASHQASTTPVAVPDKLRPAAQESLAMVVPARGVQVYQCSAAKDAGAYEWAFVAPDAELFDTSGKRIGTYGAGPFWQAADGSRISATVKARAAAPAAGAIPWLLLAARDTGPAGAFSKVSSIQRVNTVGGIAPSQPCDRESLGKEARVPYTADYRFFVQLSSNTYK